MGLLSELMKKLGIDEEGDPGIFKEGESNDPGIMVDPPPRVARGNTPSTFGKSMQLLQSQESPAKAAGLEPLPPEKYTAYVGDDKGIEWSPTREGAKTMAEASLAKRLKDAERYGAVRPEELQAETNTPGGEEALALARRRNREPTPAEVLADYESKGNTDKANKPTPPIAKKVTGASDEEKARLAAAFESAGVNPEESGDNAAVAAETKSTEPDAPDVKRRPLGFVGPLDVEHPNKTPEQQAEAGGSGGPIGEVAKLVMGSNDPRFADLKKSLSRREQLLRQADAEQAGGSGADIAGGTNFNARAGEGTRRLADAVGQDAETLLEQHRKEGDFTSRQLTSEQDRRLRESQEGRAQSAEQRAAAAEGRQVSKEGRETKKFDTEQAEFDPTSQTSVNARAEMEAIYPQLKQKIPKETWEKFSAADVKRVFGEVSQKDYASKGAGALTAAQREIQARADDKALADYEAHLVQPGTIEAYQRIAGRLQDKRPLYSVGTVGKAVQGALGAVPVMGSKLAANAGSALRSMTPEGQQLYQDAMRVMQQITLDTTGKAMTEQEREDIKTRIGLASGDENSFRSSIQHELEAAKAKAERQLQARNDRVRKMAKERGIEPDWTPRGGGALPYAYEAEGRGDEAKSAEGRPPIDEQALRDIEAQKKAEEERKLRSLGFRL